MVVTIRDKTTISFGSESALIVGHSHPLKNPSAIPVKGIIFECVVLII